MDTTRERPGREREPLWLAIVGVIIARRRSSSLGRRVGDEGRQRAAEQTLEGGSDRLLQDCVVEPEAVIVRARRRRWRWRRRRSGSLGTLGICGGSRGSIGIGSLRTTVVRRSRSAVASRIDRNNHTDIERDKRWEGLSLLTRFVLRLLGLRFLAGSGRGMRRIRCVLRLCGRGRRRRRLWSRRELEERWRWRKRATKEHWGLRCGGSRPS